MSSRLNAAYDALDSAIREFSAANEEECGTAEPWSVGHWAVVIGQQRFTESGGIASDAMLVLPDGGPLNYATEGLLGRVPVLMKAYETPVEVEADE